MSSAAAGSPLMRVARYHDNNFVPVQTQERPRIGDGEVLVRVMACGICGSDALEWFRVPKSPRILGHEISGVVAETRSADWPVGCRVVVRNQVPCQRCYTCRQGHHAVCEEQAEIEPGGMAEFVRVPQAVAATGLTKLPSHLSFEAGTLAEPIACVLHAQQIARVPGRRCLVVFGCGVFGLLHIQVALASGVGRVVAIDTVGYRRNIALRLGATVALPPDADLAGQVRQLNDGLLADVAVVATGAVAAVASASAVVARHGAILLFGAAEPDVLVPLTLNELFWRRELTITSSYGAGDVDLARSLALIESGHVDSGTLITHVLPLSDAQSGFKIVSQAGDSLKVVLDMTQ